MESFKAVVEAEIEKADQALRKGVARNHLYTELTKYGLERAADPEPGRPDPARTYRAEITGAPVRGAKNALVTIVQFSDYQCPFCSRVEPTLARILTEYQGQVRVAWRDLPLKFHSHAKSAAIAARAAGRQGKFWQMHDRLVAGQEEQDGLSPASQMKYAEELGLDMEVFKADVEGEELVREVEEDAAMAARLGVEGTPGFFINGKFLSGAQPFETFKSKIDEELNRARKMVAKGTPRAKVYTVIMRNAAPGVAKP